jgi:Zn-dependent protease
MSVTSICQQDHAALDPALTQCPSCQAEIFHWKDGNGRSWRLEATPEELVFEPEAPLKLTDEATRISRERWRQAVTFAPSDGRVVLHFDTGKREIGFGVSQEEAKRLFEAMAGKGVDIPPLQPVAGVARPASRPAEAGRKRSPLWPKMSALGIASLLCAAFAIIPVAGVVFALAAIICAALAIRRAPDNSAHAHIRWMARASIALAIVGVSIGGWVTWSTFHASRAVGWEGVLDTTESLVWGRDIEWSWGARIAAFVMVLFALSIHEASHAISAWWCGDGLARSLGRVTLNPLSHIDPFGTILLPLMLTLADLPVFGYARPVPTQLAHVPKHWRAQALVAAAGPVSNILQACVCLMLLMLMGKLLQYAPEGVKVAQLSSIQPIVEITGLPGGQLLAAVALLLKLGFQINVMLAFFNLIPIPPLDGSWIAEYLAPRFVGNLFRWIRPYGFFLFILLMSTGALSVLLTPGLFVMIAGHSLLALATGM